jgi:Ca2+-binding RTX toxin-like protein
LGGDGNDTLDGGAGADALAGGLGDDAYWVENAGDSATEAAGAGVDTVYSAVSWILGDNVENLVLGGWYVNIDGKGNALANRLTGNDWSNVLDGQGGADALAGLGGDDTYLVAVPDGATVAAKTGRTTLATRKAQTDAMVARSLSESDVQPWRVG